MKAKKLMSVLLALLIALAILPIATGAAGDPFCTVGTASYDDLAAAAQAAASSGKPILITKDFDYTGQLELDGLDVAIELRGFTLNVTQASGTGAAGAGLSVRNGGALTVNGPGALNFKGSSAGIYVGSADAGDYGIMSITGNAAVNATGSHGVVSNNSLNEVQVTGAVGGRAAGNFCVYCPDGKIEVFGSMESHDFALRAMNGVYADNNAEVHVYGHIAAAEDAIYCPAAAAARVWVLGRIAGGLCGFAVGGARAEGFTTSFTYPGYEEWYRIQKYSGANAIGRDPEYPPGYVFESRVWAKIPAPITPEPITGVTSPAAGAMPSSAIGDGTNFTAELRSWSPYPPRFGAHTVYTAAIELKSNPGYDFIGLDTDALIEGFTVNGIKPKFESNSFGYLKFTVTFPVTGEFPVTITTEGLPGGSVGTAYSQTLAAISAAPVTWSIDSGTLPAGLSLNPATGAITGTPMLAGTAEFSVKAVNGAGDAARLLYIEVNEVSVPPTITTARLEGGKVGTTYGQTLEAICAGPITWSIAGGALPAGLTLDTATGNITGTLAAAGTANFTVRATNGAGDTTRALSIAVSPETGIFDTNAKWYGAWWHYLLFFFCFGFVWMWF